MPTAKMPFAVSRSSCVSAFSTSPAYVSHCIWCLAVGGKVIYKIVLIFISTCAITAMIVYIFEHIQWRWALNDFTAHGYWCRADQLDVHASSPGTGSPPAWVLLCPYDGPFCPGSFPTRR